MSSRVDRVVGYRRSDEPGPTLIAVAAMHGNEPAGLIACQEVFEAIDELGIPFRGEFVSLVGNTEALETKQRFINEDLNRIWTEERIAQITVPNAKDSLNTEERECVQLLAELDQIEGRARGEIFLLDLHSTSSRSVPFGVAPKGERARAFADIHPIPFITGLDQRAHGFLFTYTSTCRGWPSLVLEGGHHLSELTVENHVTALWVSLFHMGCVNEEDYLAAGGRLIKYSLEKDDIPKYLNPFHRHEVTQEARFRMRPGYVNFQPVLKGEVLAEDHQGTITAPEDCLVFLPLYQAQGDDGFYLLRADI